MNTCVYRVYSFYKGPPDPPNNVIARCVDNANKAEIEWQPGRENYAPILNYIIQFNTTFAPDTWINIDSNVSRDTRSMEVELSPWGNYTFRVLARNKIGTSYPSEHTKTVCRTDLAEPAKNPANVIVEGDQPNNLVVFWTVSAHALCICSLCQIREWRTLHMFDVYNILYVSVDVHHKFYKSRCSQCQRLSRMVQASNTSSFTKTCWTQPTGNSHSMSKHRKHGIR